VPDVLHKQFRLFVNKTGNSLLINQSTNQSKVGGKTISTESVNCVHQPHCGIDGWMTSDVGGQRVVRQRDAVTDRLAHLAR